MFISGSRLIPEHCLFSKALLACLLYCGVLPNAVSGWRGCLRASLLQTSVQEELHDLHRSTALPGQPHFFFRSVTFGKPRNIASCSACLTGKAPGRHAMSLIITDDLPKTSRCGGLAWLRAGGCQAPGAGDQTRGPAWAGGQDQFGKVIH